ncbi:sigma-70 family RNA polymerase sigma factor [Knoellia locipacati]|uniref:DNA-directed RNA polymerase sigma-70 factor n=1 Tax=Knoellia locipacati TaxID=882824 RepID=A0A512T079_9MICO|nr:sigma-70 family RNA polymerase sigma factor [Knoellia locipacati]GEQ13591.1 DNA-directed RNA polymerase sigma-70 factor [Knoellia locipacati]
MSTGRTDRPEQAGQTAPSLAVAAAQAFSRHRDGDSSAMDRLVDDVTPLLWHTARSQGADRATAEDVVQTTWLRLVEHTHDIADPQAVLQWLLMTTKREAWSAVRRGRRTVPREPWDEPPTSDPTAPAASPDPALASEESELARAIWQHIESLPARCQQLLRLVAFVDRPDYSVVSASLGIPVGSIGPTRGRCLAKLRLALTADPTWEVTA